MRRETYKERAYHPGTSYAAIDDYEASVGKKEKKDDLQPSIVRRQGPDGQYLVAFGIRDHKAEVNEDVWKSLFAWDDFLYRTRTNPEKRVVLYEGLEYPIPAHSTQLEWLGVDGDVEGASEMLLFRGIATQENIPAISIEPHPNYSEANEIADSFIPADIILYYFMRLGPQMARTGVFEEEAVRNYLQTRLTNMKKSLCPDDKSSPFATVNFSYGAMRDYYFTKYGRGFSVADWEFLQSETAPMYMPAEQEPDESSTKQIARAVNRIRDREYLSLIKALWDEGYSIFSIAGKIHVDNIKLEQFGEAVKNDQESYV